MSGTLFVFVGVWVVVWLSCLLFVECLGNPGICLFVACGLCVFGGFVCCCLEVQADLTGCCRWVWL